MKDFLEKNKLYIDFGYKVFNIIIKIGIAGLITYLIKFVNVINGFVANNNGLILTFIIFCIVIIIWELRTIRIKINSLIVEELNVISDEEVYFSGSKKYPTIPEAKAVPGIIHDTWRFDSKYYHELKNSKWITHTEKITNEEAIYGGDYTFTKKFQIPFDKKKIKSSEIYFVVDDFCVVIVNGKKVHEKVSGDGLLHSYDIKSDLRQGENELKLIIENVSFESFLKENPKHDFALTNEKYRWNPYGIRFCLTIEYIK